MTDKIRYHRDGTVSYFSIYRQTWERKCFMPAHELAALSPADRKRVSAHQRAALAAAKKDDY